MRPFLFAWLLLGCAANAIADEAIDWQGRKHRGELVQEADTWVFRGADAKDFSIKQIAYIRFSVATTPLPRAPLTHSLHLPHRQQIAGMLQTIDAKQIAFVTAWGQSIRVDRNRVVGVEQARSARILLHDDFEQGQDRSRAFFGAASLLLDQPQPNATRTWKPALTDGDIRLYFYDLANDPKASFSFEVIPAAAQEPMRTLLIDGDGYACNKQRAAFGVLKPSAGWHQLNLELRSGRLRVYVDDSCLGERPTGALQGIRIRRDGGKLWIDELIVTQRLPVLPQPKPAPDVDTLWLMQGEQLFGQLLHADRRTATLDSKLGKRTIAWSQMRGIFFAQPKESMAANEPEVTFRPGPGYPLDQLRAKLLRWDQGKLIVRHELLGEIALERARLDKIRWLAK